LDTPVVAHQARSGAEAFINSMFDEGYAANWAISVVMLHGAYRNSNGNATIAYMKDEYNTKLVLYYIYLHVLF
jgi:hypothetical protein